MPDTPWDIYVDERMDKGRQCLGFLVIPNTASFMHKLHRCRTDESGRFIAREVHWNRPHMDTVRIVERWLSCVFQHRGVKFYLAPWPREQTKELVILHFLSRFAKSRGLLPPHNVVMFLDFHSSHATTKIQNHIREIGRIARCYHFDGLKNDCLQFCDLLIGATVRLRDEPQVQLALLAHRETLGNRLPLRDSEVKAYIAAFLGELRDQDRKCVRDLT